MSIFNSKWKDDVFEEYLEDQPIGAPCKSDRADDFRTTYQRMVDEHVEEGLDPKDITKAMVLIRVQDERD